MNTNISSSSLSPILDAFSFCHPGKLLPNNQRSSTIAKVHSTPGAFLAAWPDLTSSNPTPLAQTHQTMQWMRLIHRGNWNAIKALVNDDNIARLINSANTEGRTALMLAVCAQRLDVVQALRSSPALRVNDSDVNGSTALILAAYIGNAEIVNALQDVDVNAQDHDGDTALIIAAATDRVAAVASLLRAPEINPNMVNKLGLSALHCAALNNQCQIVSMLLDTDDIDPNIADDDGHTALMLAIANSNLEVVELLRQDPRLDIKRRDHANRTAMNLAQENGDTELIARLQQTMNAQTAACANRTPGTRSLPGSDRWRLAPLQLVSCCTRSQPAEPLEDIPLMNMPRARST
jgi:ankyrin repeat protein